MATTQLLVHLPDGLLRRFKRHVSVRPRSRFIQRLLEDALPPEDRDDDPLSKRHWPSRKTRHWRLKMAEWEAASIADGLSDSEAIGRAEFRRGMRSIAGRG